MKIKVQLAEGEAVEDWMLFRDVFVVAAEELGLELEQIIHTEGPL